MPAVISCGKENSNQKLKSIPLFVVSAIRKTRNPKTWQGCAGNKTLQSMNRNGAFKEK